MGDLLSILEKERLKNKLIEHFEKALKHPNMQIKEAAMSVLPEMAWVVPEYSYQVLDDLISDWKNCGKEFGLQQASADYELSDAKKAAIEKVGKLPHTERSIDIIIKGIEDAPLPIDLMFHKFAYAIAELRPDKYLELLPKLLQNKGRMFFNSEPSIKKGLPEIAKSRTEEYVDIYLAARDDSSYPGREKILGSLHSLAGTDIGMRLLDEGMASSDEVVRKKTASCLANFGGFEPHKVLDYYRQAKSEGLETPSYGFLLWHLMDGDEDLAVGLFEESVDADHNFFIQSPGLLRQMAENHPDLVRRAYETALNNLDPYVRVTAVEKLDILADFDLEAVEGILDLALHVPDTETRKKAYEKLYLLSDHSPEKCVALYEDAVDDEPVFAAHMLDTLASIKPEKAVEEFRKLIADDDKSVRLPAAERLGVLADIDIESAKELFEDALQKPEKVIRYAVALNITEKLAELDGHYTLNLLAEKLAEPLEFMSDSDAGVIHALSSPLREIAERNPGEFLDFLESIWDELPLVSFKDKQIHYEQEVPIYGSDDSFGKEFTLHTKEFPGVAYINHECALSNITKAFIGLKDAILSDNEVYLDDEITDCLKEILDSDYFREEDIDLLRREVSRGIDPYTTRRVLRAGKARSLEELLECSRFGFQGTFLKRLGSGKAGTTYLVHSATFGAEMAMKVVEHADVMEARLLRESVHKNVVHINYAGEDFVTRDREPVFVILTEYVDGRTIGQMMEENPRGLDSRTALDYSNQLLEGIAYLARNGVFHRDVHPENVKVDSGGTVKILDFGIAAHGLGNPPKDNRRYGGRSDLFSWALVTYKMLTGRHLLDPGNIPKEDYAEKIRVLKGEMRQEDGSLQDVYVEKIQKETPKGYHRPLQTALEYVKDIGSTTCQVRKDVGLMTVDKEKKTHLEEMVGKSLTDSEYLDYVFLLNE